MKRELLTQREYEISMRVAKGFSNTEIASYFCLSLRTVQTHLSSIFKKLGIKRRTQLARLFYKDLSVHKRKPTSDSQKNKFDKICTYPMLAEELMEKTACSSLTAYRELKKRGLLIKSGILIVYEEKIWRLSNLAIAHNLPEATIRARIFTLGWSVERALTTKLAPKS